LAQTLAHWLSEARAFQAFSSLLLGIVLVDGGWLMDGWNWLIAVG
jgi:hypothetical protein